MPVIPHVLTGMQRLNSVTDFIADFAENATHLESKKQQINIPLNQSINCLKTLEEKFQKNSNML
jgi:hypothetical protein